MWEAAGPSLIVAPPPERPRANSSGDGCSTAPSHKGAFKVGLDSGEKFLIFVLLINFPQKIKKQNVSSSSINTEHLHKQGEDSKLFRWANQISSPTVEPPVQ